MRASLTHPVFLVALVLLLLNDHWLKATYPGLLTGKLSDVAGLLAFAWCLAGVLPKGAHTRMLAFVATAIGFVWYKSPLADGFIESWSATFYPIARVIDPTDLLALAVLPLGYAVLTQVEQNAWRPRFHPQLRTVAQVSVLGISVFAFAATSEDDGLFPTDVFVTVNLPVDTSYTITTPRVLETNFRNRRAAVELVPRDSCLTASWGLLPIRGFSALQSNLEFRVGAATDSTVIRVTQIFSLVGTVNEDVYTDDEGVVDINAARADLENIPVDSVLQLLEFGSLLQLRLGADPGPEIRYFPCN